MSGAGLAVAGMLLWHAAPGGVLLWSAAAPAVGLGFALPAVGPIGRGATGDDPNS